MARTTRLTHLPDLRCEIVAVGADRCLVRVVAAGAGLPADARLLIESSGEDRAPVSQLAGPRGDAAAFAVASADLVGARLSLELADGTRIAVPAPGAAAPAPAVPAPAPRAPWGRAGDELLLLAPGVLVVIFSFQAGGFFVSAPALVVVALLVALLLRVTFAVGPFAGLGVPYVVAAAALGLLALWTLVSSAWSDAPARALVEHDRALLYALGFVLFGAIGRSSERLRWMLRAVAAAAVAVCACALITRLLPGAWPTDPGIAGERLSYPLTYWNALGLLAAIGLVLCFALTCDARESRAGRVLAAAALPIAAVTLLLTYSRGSIGVAILGLVTVVVVGRPRALLSGLVVALPSVAVALMAAYGADLLASADATSADAAAQGREVAIVVAVCVALAALGRTVLLRLDRRLAQLALPPSLMRPRVRWGAATAAAVVAVGVVLSLSLSSAIGEQYERFVDGEAVDAGGLGDRRDRLTIPDNNGRIEQWRVAIDGFREQPLHGEGAGTFVLRWDRERPRFGVLTDAHSLYAEILDELGIVGLALLLAALLAILGGFLALARGRDRVVGGALFAAGLAWAVHAGIEWDWEMPAVTFWLFAIGGLALAAPQGERSTAAGATMPRPLRVIAVVACVGLMVVPLRLYASEGPLRDARRAYAARDCPRAIDRARDASAILAVRPEPYVVAGHCEVRLGRPRSAMRTFAKAISRDPRNWEMHYGLAVARAAAGVDPRGRLQVARRLNPLEPAVGEALALFRSDDPQTWRRRAPRARVE